MNITIRIDVEKAAAMWSEGIQMEHIAARFGASVHTLRSIVKRNRDVFPIRERESVKRRNAWTPERLEEASMMWKANISASIIGEKLGVDRKTICRMAFDRRDLFPKKTNASLLAARRTPSTPKQRQVRVHNAAVEFIAEIEAPIPPNAFDADRLPHAKTLIDLGRCECKWPVNHGGPFLFCAEVTDGSAYCDHHYERSQPSYARKAA